jgi:undecaprenyl-phosphate galactose phosphotransferase/putative colanic acid biosynthesis UDP-glucose lipid carrier transferase
MTTVSDAIGEQLPASRSRRSRLGLSFQILEPLLALTDGALIVSTSVIGGAAYQVFVHNPVGDFAPYVAQGLIASVAYALAAHRSELYRLQSMMQRRRDYPWVAAGWVWAILIVSVVLFLLKRGADVSRGSLISFAILGGLTLVLWRAVFKGWLARAVKSGTVHGRRVIMLGTDEELGIFCPGDLMSLCGLHEVGRVPLPQDDGGQQRGLQTESIAQALEQARRGAVEEIILALPWGNKGQLDFIRERLRLSPLPVRLLPDRSVQSILNYRTWRTQDVPLIEIQRAPLSASERIAKRALDVLVALCGLALLLPLMGLVAAAIRLGSPGPAIFRQRRNGFNGHEFTIYKFRTMRVMEDGPEIVQARKSDARVTHLGRLLRQTSIDELPQLFNVLRGDMSLVGPRPHALAHDNEYSQLIANYAFRHHVKPGITGWAQVNGLRGATPELEDMANRVELDLWYINNWSLGLDLQILLRTSFDLVHSHNNNAY